MSMRYKARRDPDLFPPGWYPAKLVKTEEGDGADGPYIKWEFRASRGEESVTTSCITSAGFGSRSREYKFMSAFLGHNPQDGETFDLEDAWGLSCHVKLECKELDFGVVNKVIDVRPPQQSEIVEPESEEADVPF